METIDEKVYCNFSTWCMLHLMQCIHNDYLKFNGLTFQQVSEWTREVVFSYVKQCKPYLAWMFIELQMPEMIWMIINLRQNDV